MTEIEKNAEWLKKQRNHMGLAVTELAKILTIANLDRPALPRYFIFFDISMAGNCICLRVCDSKDFSTVEQIQLYNIRSVMSVESHLNKERIEDRIVGFLREIARMKLCINKYLKLNKKKVKV